MDEAVIEALLFVAGDEGLSLEEMSTLLETSTQEIYAALTQLQQKYELEKSGLTLLEVGNRFELATKKEFSDIVKKYAVSPFATSLSQAALETLAIIAYKQPVTRMEVDEIRGVQSSGSIHKLVLRDLIEEKGRVEAPGRPIIYGTTDYFMNYFGLKALTELPDIAELEAEEEEDETELFYERFTKQLADIDNQEPNETM